MMYVAITKRVADLADKSRFKGLPDQYPVECVEGLTKEELLAAWPKAQVLSVEEYYVHNQAMAMLYDHVMQAKPWWKFWA